MQTERFRAACEARWPETLEFLRRMVEINSFTANADGVNAVGSRVAETFARLDFRAERTPCPGFGDHVFLRGPHRPGRPTLALVSHLDTVFPPEEEIRNAFRWRPEGRRIYGPGTNDIKGGTALIELMLAALRAAEPETFAAANWLVALNACEEVDSAHFGAACARIFPADTRAALIFEADGGSGDKWAVVAARKGRASYRVAVDGRAAHAGGGHAQGANAIVQLGKTVGRLAALTDYARGVTVNVGTIAGGTVDNRVPHEATATLEMRAFDAAAFAETDAAILALGGEGSLRSADGHPCRVTITREDECAPWPPNAESDGLYETWRAAGAELGFAVQCQERGGLSDGNVLWARFPTLDGLGPRGGHAHCSEQAADGSKTQEWVDAASFVPKALINARAIARLLGR